MQRFFGLPQRTTDTRKRETREVQSEQSCSVCLVYNYKIKCPSWCNGPTSVLQGKGEGGRGGGPCPLVPFKICLCSLVPENTFKLVPSFLIPKIVYVALFPKIFCHCSPVPQFKLAMLPYPPSPPPKKKKKKWKGLRLGRREAGMWLRSFLYMSKALSFLNSGWDLHGIINHKVKSATIYLPVSTVLSDRPQMLVRDSYLSVLGQYGDNFLKIGRFVFAFRYRAHNQSFKTAFLSCICFGFCCFALLRFASPLLLFKDC